MTWISVDDELPEADVPVWAGKLGANNLKLYAINAHLGRWWWSEVYSYYTDSKGNWRCDSEANDDYSFITHWQYLPEPIK